ncbi:MAG: archease [Melioribacteraceae bacterium]|nr:archease [Melioribacteraceae bacterium]
MGSYSIIDHPADIAIRLECDDEKDLFKTALTAFNKIVIEENKFQKMFKQKIKLKLSAVSIEVLLISFLNEINYMLIAKKIIVSDIDNISIDIENKKYKLSSELNCAYNLDKQIPLKEEIKSVTHHNAELKIEGGRYCIDLVFDV